MPFPSPEGLPDPGIEPGSPALQADLYLLSYEGSPCVTLGETKGLPLNSHFPLPLPRAPDNHWSTFCPNVTVYPTQFE